MSFLKTLVRRHHVLIRYYYPSAVAILTTSVSVASVVYSPTLIVIRNSVFSCASSFSRSSFLQLVQIAKLSVISISYELRSGDSLRVFVGDLFFSEKNTVKDKKIQITSFGFFGVTPASPYICLQDSFKKLEKSLALIYYK